MNMKKLVSVLLALIMVLAMAAPALASSEGTTLKMEGSLTGGKITIENAREGETYNVYQIFYLDNFKEDTQSTSAEKNNLYSYKINSEWEEFITNLATDYITVDKGYVTWKGQDSTARAAAFAKLLKAEIDANPSQYHYAATTTGAAKGQSTVIDSLMLGYYLLDSSVGATCSLDTTDKEVVIRDKNPEPTIDKEVQEDSNSAWGKADDADIGQTVNFRTTVKAQPAGRDYVVHDKMEDGLTLDENSIVISDLTPWTNDETDWDYKVVAGEALTCEEDCDFHVEFNNKYIGALTAATDIVITYSATLNSNANIGTTGNKNDTRLDYGNSSKTEWITTKTYTWQIVVDKFTKSGNTTTQLSGAVFELTKDMAGDNKVKLVADSTDATVYKVLENQEETDTTKYTTQITTPEDGKLDILGLDEGTYYLHEVTAPEGYNKLVGPIKVVISHTGDNNDKTKLTQTIVYYNHQGSSDNPYLSESNPGNTAISVENKSGIEMPSTGGIGTTLFYVLGSILVLGAAIVLITRRRVGAEK